MTWGGGGNLIYTQGKGGSGKYSDRNRSVLWHKLGGRK